MIEQQCVLADAANEIGQCLVEPKASQKVTVAKVRRLVQEKLSSAGLHPNVSRVAVTPRFFVEITLLDASKLPLAEQIMREQVGAVGKRGISLTYIARAVWAVDHVNFMGVGRGVSGEFINVLRFKARLRSGQVRSEVEVRVDPRALDRLLKRLRLGANHVRHSNNGAQPRTITKVIEELLALDLSLGCSGHWDPVRFPQWELGEEAIASFLQKEMC